MNGDPASLANLNDIVLLPAPDWWPPAPGWYALAAILLVAVAWSGYRRWVSFRKNRYRRAALSELDNIAAGSDQDAIKDLPALLKRTALHAYSRERVAALSGEEWRNFLNSHCETDPFSGEVGALLNSLAYQSAKIQASDLQPLIKSIRSWVKQHRAEPC